MTGARLLLPAGVGLAAVLAGALLPGAVAAVLVVAIVVLAGLVDRWLLARRLRQVAAQLETWLAREHHRTVRLPPGAGWRELEVALNALGAAYQRRGLRLRRERPWRRELVDSLVSPALLVSAEDRVLAVNDAARHLLGWHGDEGGSVLATTGSAPLAAAVHEARDTGVPVTLDIEHDRRHLRCVVSLAGDELLLMLTDRTRERRVEELRRNFVVNASHELKTPVTSIRTLAEALEITAARSPEDMGPLVARLGGEAERLSRLVHDLLDLRRLEEGEALPQRRVDLARLLRDVAAELVERADRREVELAVEAPDRLEVVGDEGDLRTVVHNLVGNAIQYNRPGGRVDVVLALDTARTATRPVVLRVSDTGIGIPEHDRERIFERFYRVDEARSRETGGTGLGLALVRHAVERHGGTVAVASEPGRGTTFTVALPRDGHPPARGGTEAEPPPTTLRAHGDLRDHP